MKSLAYPLLFTGIIIGACFVPSDPQLWANEKTTKKQPAKTRLTLTREKNMLYIHGDHIPGGKIPIYYLEAYCRANSTDADWGKHTVIKHETQTNFQKHHFYM